MRIDETLLNEAKAYAARNGRSLTSVMEDALRQLLNRSTEAGQRPHVELPTYGDPADRGKVDLSPERIAELLLEDDLEYFRRFCREDA
ncbi:hypothetical protein [Nonomuraea typhae]|uniref:DUF2191 domain-containing protein n=1 Tax=Nonomuraea typhae TaxID=2603600 RepID=A0ABW7YTW8_9ACTN